MIYKIPFHKSFLGGLTMIAVLGVLILGVLFTVQPVVHGVFVFLLMIAIVAICIMAVLSAIDVWDGV